MDNAGYQAHRAAIAAHAEAFAPYENGRQYLNFTEEHTDPARFYTPHAYRKLRQVKRAYDPGNLIRANHQILPAIGRAGVNRSAGTGPARGRSLSAGLDSEHGESPGARKGFRASARAEAAADRLRRRGRARGPRGCARQALDQEGVEALRARARDPDDGSDDARGRRHAGQGARARDEGDPAGPDRRLDPVVRGAVRLPEPRAGGGRAPARHRREGRVGRDRVPVGPVAARREGARDRGGRRDGRGRGRHGDRPRRVPLRPLREGLRRDRPGEAGLRRGAPEGDPRGRRARHVRQRPPRVAAGDGRRRRLHQDLDRASSPARRRCPSRSACSRRSATSTRRPGG